MSIESGENRLRLVEEPCRFCGASSSSAYPGGVVAGQWKWPDWKCGRWQNEEQRQRVDEDDGA